MEFDTVSFKRGRYSYINTLKRFIHRSSLILSSCDLCGNKCQEYPLICQFCLQDLPTFNYPIISSDLLNWPAINKLIPKQAFDHLYSLSPHTWPYSQWIGSLKYNGRFELAGLLARLLNDSWQTNIKSINKLNDQPKPELVLAVPLYLTKWQFRGYNQAHLIAKKFAKYSGIKYKNNVISRILETEAQVGKTGTKRRKNIKNAFAINTQIMELPKHVILIDDVVTTGTTVNEISTLLKRNGVEIVSVMSVTIALPKSE